MLGDEVCVFSYDNASGTATSTATATAAAAAAAAVRGGVSGGEGDIIAIRAEACNALGLLLESGAASADGSALPDVAASLFLVAATTGYPQAWLNLLPLLTATAIASSKVVQGLYILCPRHSYRHLSIILRHYPTPLL
jgi:hypothetical protein